MTSPGMSRLELLPAELLCNIMNRLKRHRLVAIAGVSKTLRPFAESTLYPSVKILSAENAFPDPDDTWPDEEYDPLHLANFLRTMLHRPDLRNLVKSIALVVSPIDVPVSVSHLFSAPIPESPVAPTLNITLTEAELAGTLLTLLPKVKELALDTYNILDDDEANALNDLFRGRRKRVNANPALVAAFRNLTKLTWSSRSLPFCMACLPHLNHLVICCECTIEVCEKHEGGPQISKLTLHRNTTVFFPEASLLGSCLDAALIPFLKRCSLLTHLNLILDPQKYRSDETLSEAVIGDLNKLLESIHEAAPELESIAIGVGKRSHNRFLSYITPISSNILRLFKKLRHLRVPQILLLGSDNDESPIEYRAIADLLPASLEHLEVEFPGETIFDFLEWVVKERGTVRSLSQITMYCGKHGCGRGVECTDKNGGGGILALWNGKCVVKKLRDIGLLLSFTELKHVTSPGVLRTTSVAYNRY